MTRYSFSTKRIAFKASLPIVLPTTFARFLNFVLLAFAFFSRFPPYFFTLRLGYLRFFSPPIRLLSFESLLLLISIRYLGRLATILSKIGLVTILSKVGLATILGKVGLAKTKVVSFA